MSTSNRLSHPFILVEERRVAYGNHSAYEFREGLAVWRAPADGVSGPVDSLTSFLWRLEVRSAVESMAVSRSGAQ